MWLLEQNAVNTFEAAIKSGITPTAEQQQNFEASHISANDGQSRILTTAGNSAQINITGVLTQRPNWMAAYFGGGNTTYSEIISAISQADADPNVTEITLNINSPGGAFDGLFDAIAAIQLAKKPINAVIDSVGASAAYAIASQAATITAKNRAARIGSVGVVATFYLSDSELQITSTNAPNKRPDVKTAEGRDAVRAELDELHQIFVEAIAEGRGVTVKDVNNNFGRGGTYLADTALKNGMIDAVSAPALTVVNQTEATAAPRGGITTQEKKSMNLNELKAAHPDTYQAALEQGINQERDRVTAHLIMGEKSGAMATASEAIKNGDDMTATLQATYLTAGMNKADIQARQTDDASAADGSAAPETQADAGADVAALVEQQLGIEG